MDRIIREAEIGCLFVHRQCTRTAVRLGAAERESKGGGGKEEM